MVLPKPLAMRINKKGDRGSPYIIPREGEKGWAGAFTVQPLPPPAQIFL